MTEQEMEARIKELEGKVEQLQEQIAGTQKQIDSVFFGIGLLVESRDKNTGQHIFRTKEVVEVFVKELLARGYEGLTEEMASNIVKAAPLHDVGKLSVDDEILRKQGRFNDEEYAKIKVHSAEGGKLVYMALSDLPDTDLVHTATNLARYHHERWDGKGYPTGKSGIAIPLEARIMAFADVFDALVSKRCYKESYSYDKAFAIMEEGIGTQFDPDLGRIFMECRPQLEQLYDELVAAGDKEDFWSKPVLDSGV